MNGYVEPFGYYNPCGYIEFDCDTATQSGGVWLPGLNARQKEEWLLLVREERLRRDYPEAFAPEAVNPVAERLSAKIVETETEENRATSALLLRLELEQRGQTWNRAFMDRMELHRRAFSDWRKMRRKRATEAVIRMLGEL